MRRSNREIGWPIAVRLVGLALLVAVLVFAAIVLLAPGPLLAAPAPSAGANAELGDRASSDDDLALAGPRRAVRGPGVAEVLAAAYAAAGLDRDPQDGWLRRARLSGLVPWITVRTARDTSWQDEHAEVGHATSLELRATWRLDRLLFDGRELQVAGVEAARRRERRRLAARVIRSYFTWRRAASIASDDERVAMRVAEAVAELDALTDGWFSAQLRESRGAASGGGAGSAKR